MSSNLSLSSFSHSSLKLYGAQQNSPADTSPKITGLFDDVQLSPSMGGFEFELSELDIEQISPPPLEKKDLSFDFDEDIFLSTSFEDLCLRFSMQETDLGPLRERFTRFDSAVALYNDFDGQKTSVWRINEVFQEVFTKLQAGEGFEGHLGAFFVARIGQLTQSSLISKKEASYLTTLAKQYVSRPQDLGPSEYEQPQGSSLNFAQRYKNSSQSNWDGDDGSMQCNVFSAPTQFDDYQKSREKRKSWLVAAMVLGLMASYPLILKPTCQAAGDLIRRMRGISVPKVQG